MMSLIRNKVKIGDVAPELELPLETGEMFSLAQLTGQPVMVSFLSHAA
ncbi:MAG: hypothetical protein R2747_08585 [Pyrinomonadaceae bacterium]